MNGVVCLVIGSVDACEKVGSQGTRGLVIHHQTLVQSCKMPKLDARSMEIWEALDERVQGMENEEFSRVKLNTDC